jgi:hypothetical protein
MRKTYKKWQLSDILTLTKLYSDVSNYVIAEQLGFSYPAICNKAQELQLKKSAEFLHKNMCKFNESNLFKKGHKPLNAFKKGYIPVNTKEIGSESIKRRNNNILVKTESGKWEHKHKLIWEQINGKVPKGMYIIFADKDNRNFSIENIICVDKAEMMRRNGAANYPKELCSVINQLAWYHRKLKNYEK